MFPLCSFSFFFSAVPSLGRVLTGAHYITANYVCMPRLKGCLPVYHCVHSSATTLPPSILPRPPPVSALSGSGCLHQTQVRRKLSCLACNLVCSPRHLTSLRCFSPPPLLLSCFSHSLLQCTSPFFPTPPRRALNPGSHAGSVKQAGLSVIQSHTSGGCIDVGRGQGVINC